MLNYEIGLTSPVERNDCMVRALANALNEPYYNVHARLQQLGRRNRCATRWSVCAKAMLSYDVSFASPVKRYVTHAQFVKSHPTGSFIVMSRTHAWTVRDGVVFDSWRPGPRKQIRCIGVVS